MIRTICQEGCNSYGTGHIKTILDRQNMIISYRRTARLMKEANNDITVD